MLDNIWKWMGYFLLVGIVLALGWKAPLSYRFMSRDQIAELEHPPGSDPTPEPANWQWDPDRKSSLDRGAYNYRSTRPSNGSLESERR